MTDESNTEIAENAPPADLAPPKKRRGPRPKNVVADTVVDTPEAESAQPLKGRRKRLDKSAEGNASAKASVAAKAKNVAKGTRKTRAAKQTPAASAPALDGIAELLQLEEENARLRKTLAEKLQAENAELRKRLGLI
ncbi:SyrB-like regulator [Ensifer sp. ENS07]|uniref:SyrB-like regulator n=1 Tax=Ensifer sp. ENS07 TaxID=2769274 RepID=UPI00177E1CFA|nr:SyrB-like regulator [Ensifer sp. ENS07]MBD9641751.1 SyrB-like regulator [Ensifer sp. ENS07]